MFQWVSLMFQVTEGVLCSFDFTLIKLDRSSIRELYLESCMCGALSEKITSQNRAFLIGK